MRFPFVEGKHWFYAGIYEDLEGPTMKLIKGSTIMKCKTELAAGSKVGCYIACWLVIFEVVDVV